MPDTERSSVLKRHRWSSRSCDSRLYKKCQGPYSDHHVTSPWPLLSLSFNAELKLSRDEREAQLVLLKPVSYTVARASDALLVALEMVLMQVHVINLIVNSYLFPRNECPSGKRQHAKFTLFSKVEIRRLEATRSMHSTYWTVRARIQRRDMFCSSTPAGDSTGTTAELGCQIKTKGGRNYNRSTDKPTPYHQRAKTEPSSRHAEYTEKKDKKEKKKITDGVWQKHSFRLTLFARWFWLLHRRQISTMSTDCVFITMM